MTEVVTEPADQPPDQPAGQSAEHSADLAGARRMAPDLLYSDAESQLRSAVRALLDERAGWRDVLARTEADQTSDAGLWQTLATEIGAAGLLVPEELGGAGASFREAAVVAEEVGRAVAPVPFVGSAVVATIVLRQADAPALVRQLASGEVTAALAVPFATAPSQAGGRRPVPTARLVASGPSDPAGTYRISGTIEGVADAALARHLLVPADGVPYGLYQVDASAPKVTKTAVTSLDQTRQLTDLSLDGAPASRLAVAAEAEQAVDAGLMAGAAILASEQLGLAERCLELTVAYVNERRQFARQVGSFQAIKHRLADLWAAVTQARAASRYAAACLASGDPDAAVAVALAKAYCSDTALRAAQEMIQLHGGIGFTWEHPAHLYLKRAKANSIGFGTADAHRASLARLVDLPPASARGSG